MRINLDTMIQTLRLLLQQIAVCLKSRAELHIENLVLRHQIEILRRSAPPRVRLTRADRFLSTPWSVEALLEALTAASSG